MITDPLADIRSIELPFNVDEVDPMCHECVRSQLEKYEGYIDKNGVSYTGKFAVPCSGVPKNIRQNDEIRKLFDDESWEEFLSSTSSPEFAASKLLLPNKEPWMARDYQEKILKCSARRRVLRLSRRCLVSGSMILMADGNWKPIEQIKLGEFVASRSRKNKLVCKEVILTHNNGQQDVYEIKLSNGAKVTCTANHPLLALETLSSGYGIKKVWKSIEEGLSVGDKVIVAKHYDKVVSLLQKAKKRFKQFSYERIESISYCGVSPTYDIGVKDTRNFITDGIVSHNTGKTDSISVEICYQLFTNKGVRIVLIAPHKPQVEEIMNRVKGFLRGNPLLDSCKIRDRAAPFYELELSNRSRLRGFAVGSTGGNEGVSVRGQDADYIYIEEMSYVDDEAIRGAVLPLLQTSPETYLVGFSTPSGAKDMFYRLCKESPEYKEFHYSYRVLPWYKNVEAERNEYTELKWLTEFEADFPSPEDGVYKTSYIERSKREYRYEDMAYDPRWRYVIGTDWNEVHGTEIVTVGWNVSARYFQVVDAVCIEKSEFTQLSGISKLVDMVIKWKPAFVYIDAGGGGSTNYEVLQKTSIKERKPGGNREVANLINILKKYDSGASIEARDAISGKEEKYPAKQFMVSASVRMFEQDMMRVSSSDAVLINQLHNYMIKRITPTGTPVYSTRDKSIGDHRLDALNLALVAIHLNFSDLHAPNLVTSAVPVPGPRTIEKAINRSSLFDRDSSGSPEDRRLIGSDNFLLDNTVMLPGRVSGIKVKSTRPGWAHDEEDKIMARIAQRRRGRTKRGSDLPKRSNF